MTRWFTAMRYAFREFILANLLLTIVFFGWFWRYGPIHVSLFCWSKIIIYLVTILFYYWRRKQFFYFFHNLGFTKRSLLLVSILIDLPFSLVGLWIVNDWVWS